MIKNSHKVPDFIELMKKYFCLKIRVIILFVLNQAWRTCAQFKDITEYNKCVRLLLHEMVPYLIRSGIPEANIPALEPIDFKEMLVQYKFPLFQVRANLSGMRMSHVLGNYILDNVWVDPKNLTANIRMKFPQVRTQVGYDVSGKFIVLPVNSVGHFDGNFCRRSLILISDSVFFNEFIFSSKQFDGPDHLWQGIS